VKQQLLALTVVAAAMASCASSSSTAGPVTPMTIEKARLQQEAHYVELLRASFHRRPDAVTAQELANTLMALAEIDPNNPPPDVEQRLLRVQTEVLQRYDPQLLEDVRRRRQRGAVGRLP
jgi:hypothetical protein